MSDCDHPEESLEPLDYAGRPADPDEWRCEDCGTVQMRDTTIALRDEALRDEARARVRDEVRAGLPTWPWVVDPIHKRIAGDIVVTQSHMFEEVPFSGSPYAAAVVADRQTTYESPAEGDPLRVAHKLMNAAHPRPGRFRWEVSTKTYAILLGQTTTADMFSWPSRANANLFNGEVRLRDELGDVIRLTTW